MKNDADALAKKNLAMLGVLLAVVVILFCITLVKLGSTPAIN